MIINYLSFNQRSFRLIVLILALLTNQLTCKRGGGGMGRGGSAGRSGGIFGGRRTGSNHNTGGGTFGGYKQSGNIGGNARQTNYKAGGGNYAGAAGAAGAYGNKWDQPKGSYGNSKFTKSGIGSVVRSNTFKNAIVGAAAGYLTYQAGKAIINSIARPMMWNNRPYYWGSNYYPPSSGQSMCRMPIQGNDPQFGNVYLPDNSRPREIVWGCGIYEHCCGYECCPSGGGGGHYGGSGYYGGSGRTFGQFGLGSVIVLLLLCLCGGFIIHQMFKARQSASWSSNNGRGWFGNNKYTPGQASEAPPQYTA